MAAMETDSLVEYFEKVYREGGDFQSPDYEHSDEDFLHTWRHKKTGIIVWKDAMDLSSKPNAKVFFHYTSALAFHNITALEKEAAEVFASLVTEGPRANAWWGAGVYSVPKPPDEWTNRRQLLDNNFRRMMRRDLEQHGESYVDEEYPPRAGFCIPLLIDPENVYDVSERATPEMQAAGKLPGINLADKPLNEPGQPKRCCVVLRVLGADGVSNAQPDWSTSSECARPMRRLLRSKLKRRNAWARPCSAGDSWPKPSRSCAQRWKIRSGDLVPSTETR
ncbi:Nephrocystin-3 [Durusdinium trenchii]|uniref:Nephrocystin-3 n=1 Tax=Durusdinium trenchii TaxID=1381693 RepID=A0ABP0KD80_9DINO